jgi:hypothetical protein
MLDEMSDADAPQFVKDKFHLLAAAQPHRIDQVQRQQREDSADAAASTGAASATLASSVGSTAAAASSAAGTDSPVTLLRRSQSTDSENMAEMVGERVDVASIDDVGSGADESLEQHNQMLQQMHQHFEVPSLEKLVSYFACMFWVGNTPVPSWLFVTENFLAFLPKLVKKRRVLLPLISVAAVERESGKPTITIKSKDDVAYHFSALNAGQVYRVLQQLWGAAMARVLRRTERASAIIEQQWARNQHAGGKRSSIVNNSLDRALSSEDLAGTVHDSMLDSVDFDFDEGDGKSADLIAPPGGIDPTADTTLESLALARRQSSFMRLFRLPRNEQLVAYYGWARLALRRFDLNSGLTGEVVWLGVTEDIPAAAGDDAPSPTSAGARGRALSGASHRVQQMPATLIKGEIWLSANFVAFSTPDKMLLLVVPLVRIAGFDRRVTLVGGGSPVRLLVRGGEDIFLVAKDAAAAENLYHRWAKIVDDKAALIAAQQAAAAQAAQSGLVLMEKRIPTSLLLDRAQFSSDFAEKEPKRLEAWHLYTRHYGDGVTMARTTQLRTLCRNGLPHELRAKAWAFLSGAAYGRDLQVQEYEQLLLADAADEKVKLAAAAAVAAARAAAGVAPGSSGPEPKNVREEIENDLHRSLPEHDLFQTPDGIAQLRRVLRAFAMWNPEIGYCQSMNILTAMLLTVQDEEAAFFTLRVIVEQLAPEYYRPSMIGSNVDQRVFAELLSTTFPKIAKHLADIGLPVMIISLPWFLCCYIGFVPFEVAMRILDCFFLEGPKVLFQVGLALFAVHQKRVVGTKDPVEVREILRDRIDPNELLKIAFDDFGGLQYDRIRAMRARHKFQTIRDLQEKNKKTQLRDLQRITEFTMPELETFYHAYDHVLGTASENSLSLARFEQLFVQFLPWWTHRVAAIPVDLVLRSLHLQVAGFISLREFVTLMSLFLAPVKHADDLLKFVFRLFEAGVDYLDRRRLGDAIELVYIVASSADLVPLKASPDARLIDDAVRAAALSPQHVTHDDFARLVQTPPLAAALGLFSAPAAAPAPAPAATLSSSSSSSVDVAAASPAPAAAAVAGGASAAASSLIDFEVDWNAAPSAQQPDAQQETATAAAAAATAVDDDDMLVFGFVAPTSPAARPAGGDGGASSSSLISFDGF